MLDPKLKTAPWKSEEPAFHRSGGEVWVWKQRQPVPCRVPSFLYVSYA